MSTLKAGVATIVVTVACCFQAEAQGETTLPFLLNSPSAEANGMGGTSIALVRFDPAASIFSPAQTGLSALTTNVRAGMYPTASEIVTGFGYPVFDLKSTASAVTAGVRLNDFVDLPLRIGLGIGYHQMELDYGTFVLTSEWGPEGKSMFEAYDRASGFVIGAGFEYLVRFGFGYTFRSVNSHLSPIGGETEMPASDIQENAHDYSFILEVPVVTIVHETSGWEARTGDVIPFLDLSAGLGWNNMGDRIFYVDSGQADPFPRAARAGIGMQGGIDLVEPVNWELISAAWSREVQDVLVVRDSVGWDYQSGLGDIEFTRNVFQGELTDGVGLRSGWQIRAAEIFTYREGSVRGNGSYDTRGYTVQLAGLTKGLVQVLGDNSPVWLLFARDHIDVHYHYAEYAFHEVVTRPLTYSGLVFAFRILPW